MATTSIKLPDELKKRIAKIAKQRGESPHAFMLEAIAERTERAEWRAEFEADADEAEKEFDRTGLAYDWAEVRPYLRDIFAGKKAAKPKLKPWRK